MHESIFLKQFMFATSFPVSFSNWIDVIYIILMVMLILQTLMSFLALFYIPLLGVIVIKLDEVCC